MPHRRQILRRLSRRLANESGIVAMIAVGSLAALGVVGASAVAFSTENLNHAHYSKADQQAFALAEAGINNAFAVLANPSNDPTTGTLLQSPGSKGYDGGTATWWGTYDSANRVWTVWGEGVVHNPGGTRPVKRTISAKVPVSSGDTQPIPNLAWNYLVATRTATGTGCDMSLASDASINSRLLVFGNLCFNSGSRVSGGELVVKGQATLAARDSSIGTSAAPISEAHVVVGCKYGNNPVRAPCTSADNVYARISDQTSPNVFVPVANWDVAYTVAGPGPRNGCTTSSGTVPVFDNNALRDNSVPTASLTPSTSYSCVVGPPGNPSGQLTWDAATRTLTVKGTIFVDGSMTVDVALAQYNGTGTLYLSGGFYLPGGAKLCAVASGTDCNFTYGAWNPDTELLAVAANGNGHGGTFPGNSAQFSSSTRFQGALYATNAVQFGSLAKLQGPIVASTLLTCSSQEFVPFPRLTVVPSGLPGNPTASGRVGRPYDFTR